MVHIPNTNLFQNLVQNFRNNIKIYNRYVTKIYRANINERRTYLTVVVDFMMILIAYCVKSVDRSIVVNTSSTYINIVNRNVHIYWLCSKIHC